MHLIFVLDPPTGTKWLYEALKGDVQFSWNKMSQPDTYTVTSAQNDHGCVTVRAHPRNATYHVVDYANETDRERIADLPAGSVVKLDLSRAGRRGNVWCAESVRTAHTDGGE